MSKKVTAGKRIIQVKELPVTHQKVLMELLETLRLDLKTTKTDLNASESLQATVKISGKGNLKLFSPPPLQVPSSLEKYDPEYNEKVSTSLDRNEREYFKYIYFSPSVSRKVSYKMQ